MFLYVRNGTTQPYLTNLAGVRTIPIGWWWEHLGQANTAWLALSLMCTWFFYLVVSVGEAVLWIFYMYRGKDSAQILEWTMFYFATVGYWGTIVAYFFPFLFAAIQVGSMNTSTFPGAWANYQLAFSLFWWIGGGLLHFFFVPQFIVYVNW
jgi:hypothetical protein